MIRSCRRSFTGVAGVPSQTNTWNHATKILLAPNCTLQTHTRTARSIATFARIHHISFTRPHTPPSTIVSQSSLLSFHPKRFASITTTNTSADEFDSQLTSLMETLQHLLESNRFEPANLDINLADGVLSVASPTHGTWVLNKHTPTRQIWLSSPLSGPRKYNFHLDHASEKSVGEGWLGERDTNEQLKRRLINEWSSTFQVKIDPIEDFQRHHED